MCPAHDQFPLTQATWLCWPKPLRSSELGPGYYWRGSKRDGNLVGPRGNSQASDQHRGREGGPQSPRRSLDHVSLVLSLLCPSVFPYTCVCISLMCVCPSLPLSTISLHIALSASLILSHLYPLFSVSLPPRHRVCPSIHLSSPFLLPSFKFFTSLPPRQSRVLNPTAWLA